LCIFIQLINLTPLFDRIMNNFELIKRKIEIQKQWLWMLVNLSDEELQLPKGQSRKLAKNKALDKLKQLLNELENLKQ